MIRTLTVTLLASAILLGAAGAATAKPAVCADISVSAKVRNDAGCFGPDTGPVAPSGTGDSPTVEDVPTVRTPWTWTFELPEPEPTPEEDTDDTPADAEAAETSSAIS